MNASKSAIHSGDAPAAIGPYSQAVRVGDFVFTSGQVALDPETGEMISGGIEEQTHRVLNNLQAVLAASGLSLSRAVKTTVYLKDLGNFAAMNRIYAQYFQNEGVSPPARSTVEVARLPKDALIEIDVIAG